uniref:helix-turn-helix domain-containing protein n=1 Tax=Thiolapillus sp. TaxID=2017437 RepID=UPI003AF67007
ENILERAFALCENSIITLEDLGTLQEPKGKCSDSIVRLDGENLEDYLSRIERDILLQALEESRWNKTSAAGRLGISFRSLRYRLSKLGIDNKDEDA